MKSPGKTTPQVRIHYLRIRNDLALYVEGLVEDNGTRLKTFTPTPPDISRRWSQKWQAEGLFPAERWIGSAEKNLFYHEWFTLMKICDTEGELLGYYCDVATPLQKVEGEYYLSDLVLDLWIRPDGTFIELDRDEFEAAVSQGLLTPEEQGMAVRVIERLKAEIRQGTFPDAYLK